MRTRQGECYPKTTANSSPETKRRKLDVSGGCRKKSKISPEIPFPVGFGDLFDTLPDELVLSILSKLGSTANCPADFFNVLTTYGLLIVLFNCDLFCFCSVLVCISVLKFDV